MQLRKVGAVVSFFGAFVMGAGAAFVVSEATAEEGVGEVVAYRVFVPRTAKEEMPLYAEDLVGVWTGTWGHGEKCTIEIHRFDGLNFRGTLRQDGAVISLEGTLDREARKLNFKETKVVRLGPRMDKWSLGINSGRISPDGRSLTGLGLDEWGDYDWSATKSY